MYRSICQTLGIMQQLHAAAMRSREAWAVAADATCMTQSHVLMHLHFTSITRRDVRLISSQHIQYRTVVQAPAVDCQL
jgi:hypothetical protein